jgi:hypothetical protein
MLGNSLVVELAASVNRRAKEGRPPPDEVDVTLPGTAAPSTFASWRRIYGLVRDSAYQFTTGVLFPSVVDVSLSPEDTERWQRNPLTLRTLLASIENGLRQLHGRLRSPATTDFRPRVRVSTEEDLAAGEFCIEVV